MIELSNIKNDEVKEFLQVSTQYTPAVLQTISNPDGTVSIIQVDPNNPIITLPDGTTAHVQGVATVSFFFFFFVETNNFVSLMLPINIEITVIMKYN